MAKGVGILVRSAWIVAILSSFAPPLLAAEPSSQESGIRGKVLFEGKPAAGVWIHGYLDSKSDFKGKGYASFGPTAEDGRFYLPLKPGRYYLVGKRPGSASAEADPGVGELFGYYGGNPVKVSAESGVEVNLQVVKREPMTITSGAGPNVTVTGVLAKR